MAEFIYVANAGQTYMPFQDNINVPTLPYTPLDPPNPPIPELEMKEEFLERGYILTMQCQHFLPDVTPEMLDWWWANMEKGYYLWAPGAHKRFNWVKTPWEYGFEKSAHMISNLWFREHRCLAAMESRSTAWGSICIHLRHTWNMSS